MLAILTGCPLFVVNTSRGASGSTREQGQILSSLILNIVQHNRAGIIKCQTNQFGRVLRFHLDFLKEKETKIQQRRV